MFAEELIESLLFAFFDGIYGSGQRDVWIHAAWPLTRLTSDTPTSSGRGAIVNPSTSGFPTSSTFRRGKCNFECDREGDRREMPT